MKVEKTELGAQHIQLNLDLLHYLAFSEMKVGGLGRPRLSTLSLGFPTKENRVPDRLPPGNHQRGNTWHLLA